MTDEPYGPLVIGGDPFGSHLGTPIVIADLDLTNFQPHGWWWEGEYHRFKGAPMQPDEIAHITHEANRAYQEIIGENPAPPWHRASLHQRTSVIDGVLNVIKRPELGAQESHDNWLAFKRGAGWTYGETKDEQAKTHPCLLEWNELPEADRVKDILFVSIVKALNPGPVAGGS